MILLGDSICRRFFSFVSIPHRFAAAFLTGLLVSSWWTYGSAWLFSGSSSPLLWANLVFFVTSIAAIYFLRRQPKDAAATGFDRSETEFRKWDWIFLGLFLVFLYVLMFSTFNITDGKLQIAHHQWSDFGSTLSISQSFAKGHNFPTEYPHFTGERIRYHFLFYFQVGNLEYLGLNPAWSNNLLSILSLMSMLILVMTLATVLFGSLVVGRIAAAIFFSHGSLSFLPYLYSQSSFSSALDNVWRMRDFLPSGFNYRGELWGVWSQVVYVNQRHLASSIGLFLLVLIFLIIRYRNVPVRVKPVKPVQAPMPEPAMAAALNDITGEETLADVEDQAIANSEARETYDPADSPALSIADENDNGQDILDLTGDGVLSPADQGQDKQTDAEELSPAEKVDHSGDGKIHDLPEDQEMPAADEDLVPVDDAVETAAREPLADAVPDTEQVAETEPDEPPPAPPEPSEPKQPWYTKMITGIHPFIFAGVLLGLLPMWNGAVFTAAFAVLAVLFVLFPLRRQMIVLGVVTALVALPQIYYLKAEMHDPGPSILHWGYTLGDPSILDVLYYLGFIFGLKWPLIIVALVVGTWFRLRVMIAISSLIAVTFLFQFSPEALTNHKFLNIWLVIANVFAAAGIWYLWNFRIGPTVIVGRLIAGVLTAAILVAGVMDLFPIRNSHWMEMPYEQDALVRWVSENTDPKSIFLSQRFVNHGILLAGRRVFYGHPYYAWGAGYATYERDLVYKKMFELRDPVELLRLLKENHIDYVAYDESIRKGDFIKKPNEAIYQAYFKDVFPNAEERYDRLKIYQVPDVLGEPNPSVLLPVDAPTPVAVVGSGGAFQGGEGNAGGQFSKPRGIAADAKGNIYVADTGNNRIQKFDPEGKFVAVMGVSGSGEGELKEPNGVVVDAAGSVYVTDAGNQKLLKYGPDGKFAKEWRGPDPGFYGPRDMAMGPNKQIYIVDQGRTRIVRFDPATEVFSEWGTSGSGQSQFLESTGIAIGGGFVFVADLGNNRIEAFDLDGKFVREWAVPVWERYPWHYPDLAFDEVSGRLYVTNGWKNEILAYDIDGNAVDPGLFIEDANKPENPSSLSVSEINKKRVLLVLNTGGSRVTQYLLASKK